MIPPFVHLFRGLSISLVWPSIIVQLLQVLVTSLVRLLVIVTGRRQPRSFPPGPGHPPSYPPTSRSFPLKVFVTDHKTRSPQYPSLLFFFSSSSSSLIHSCSAQSCTPQPPHVFALLVLSFLRRIRLCIQRHHVLFSTFLYSQRSHVFALHVSPL